MNKPKGRDKGIPALRLTPLDTNRHSFSRGCSSQISPIAFHFMIHHTPRQNRAVSYPSYVSHTQEGDVESVIQSEFVVPSRHILRPNLSAPSPMFVYLIRCRFLCPITPFGTGRATPAPIRTKRVVLILNSLTWSVCESLQKRIPL